MLQNSESAPKTRTERVCIAAGDSSGAIDVVEVKVQSMLK